MIKIWIMVKTENNNKKFPLPGLPVRWNKTPKAIINQNHHFLKIEDFGESKALPSGFIKLTANTGFMMKATISEANKVNINITGR